MKNINHRIKKGYTLVEVLISVFIFLIVMVAVVGVFARQTQSFRFLQTQQRNVENAQFAMNFMAKTLRTSAIEGSGATEETSTSLYVYDNSQGQCFHFEFDGNTINIARANADLSSSNTCGDSSIYGDAEQYATGAVNGQFVTKRTLRTDDSTYMRVGLITIQMEVADDNPASSKTTKIQTTVSLRDYPPELKF